MSKELKVLNPRTDLVSSFVGLLDISDNDYKEEHDLQSVLSEVVHTIRYNKELEHKVTNMDLKISLIIRNHLTTQDMICQSKRNTITRTISLKSKDFTEPTKSRLSMGLVGYSKESHLLLDAYQHLFHLLQTDPRYMARLIFSMTQDFSYRFIESIVFTLYNCGSTPREECLMLQLFGLALKEDIRTKVDKITDISTGNSLVLKIILNFFKTGSGLSSLKELLQPVVEEILNDESMYFSTDPIEIYKYWINEQELTKGQAVKMQCDLSVEQAEQIPEVVELLEKSINALKNKVEAFVNRIIECDDLLPYGICYVAKVLYQCLKDRFPAATELEIMKGVGHMLYYRYIIATIPAADTFGVVTLKPGKVIHIVQRRNLGAIAKVLQHGAAFQLFEPTSRLSVLNDFLLSCHQKFFNFLKLVCSVENPEVCFEMDVYSEATLITKPEISLTLQEIVTCRELLNKHRKDVAPDPSDPLHQLLDELGPPIILEPHSANDLITLSLTSRFSVQTTIPALDKLFMDTEQLVIQFLQCQCLGENLLEMLKQKPTEDEEKRFVELLKNSFCNSTFDMLSRFQNLSELKNQILHQLVQLELAGFVTSQDGYQAIINLIAKKIVNRNTYREIRKKELEKLHRTLTQLKLKTKYYTDTLNYYSEYIQNCLQSIEKSVKGCIKKKVLKYPGNKLVELGILVEPMGVQMKRVSFEISTTAAFGVFSVSVRFCSAPLEKVDLNIQHLLRLQYEGETFVEMFGCIKVNINLLLYFLNRKFLAS